MQAVGSSRQNFIYNEGTFPFWFELVLFLLWEALNELTDTKSLPALLCFGIFELVVDKMWNGLL